MIATSPFNNNPLVHGRNVCAMNSTNDDSASTSDPNANNISKGAIPKRRPPIKPKKSQLNATNNNVEDPASKPTTDTNGFAHPGEQPSEVQSSPYCNCIVCERQLLDLPSTSSWQPPTLDCDSTNSDETELLSISDDGCIYTYKQDKEDITDAAADLPHSFFHLQFPPPTPELPANRAANNASPEMDYLEMDFDPGPCGDTLSDTDQEGLERQELIDPKTAHTDNTPETEGPSRDLDVQPSTSQTDTQHDPSDLQLVPQLPRVLDPKTAPTGTTSQTAEPVLDLASTSQQLPNATPPPQTVTKTKIHKLIMPWSCSIRERTKSDQNARTQRYHYSGSGDLNSPTSESVPIEDVVSMESSPRMLSLKRRLIWSDEEARGLQTQQIGTSACGATAVLNVLTAFKYPVSVEQIREVVPVRLRANESPLADYLRSRSVAGCTHEDLIDGVYHISKGEIYGRFFHMWPERVVNVPRWLRFWIGQGAVPVATLNLQRNADPVPDAWHHQMVYGVSGRGVHMTNPLQVVDSCELWPQLASESVLLIRRDDVLSRWNIYGDLHALIAIEEVAWRRINVVGQVVSLVRESRRPQRIGFTHTTHIKIPASYSAGITFFIRKDSSYYTLLKCCPELPLLPTDVDEAHCSDTLY